MVPKRKDVVKVVVLFLGVGGGAGGGERGRDEKGESVERPIRISVWRMAADPAETGAGESTGLSIVLVPGAFV